MVYLPIRMLTSFGVVLALGIQTQQPLPGAKGAQFERIGKESAVVGIKEAYVQVSGASPADKAPRPQRFPSGTKALDLELFLTGEPPEGTAIDYDVWTSGGKIELADGYMGYMAVPAKQVFHVSYPLAPKVGAFADGAYQLKVLVNHKAVAALNWSIGER